MTSSQKGNSIPNLDRLRRALAAMERSVDREYFFSRLTGPSWLEAMRAEGLFMHPPATVRSGEYLQFPFWPESEYLARVASAAPSLAGTILNEIPLNDNLRVQHDLAVVATNVTDSEAGAWATREIAWLETQSWLSLLVPEKIADVVAKLAASGDKRALGLSTALLALRDSPKISTDSNVTIALPPEARGKFDGWEYGEVLSQLEPLLTKAFGIDALQLFEDLLVRALEVSQSGNTMSPTDYSFIWRPEIEHEGRTGHDVRDSLVNAVRNSAEALARAGSSMVVAELEGRKWDVFRRIALHVLRVTQPPQLDLINARLSEEDSFRSPALHHEYAMLARDYFESATADTRGNILNWIEQGKDPRRMREQYQLSTGQPLPPSTEVAWTEQWQRDRLSPIKDALPTDWKTRYEELVGRHGPPEFDFVQYKTNVGWVHPKSSKTVEELRAMSSQELRKFLAEKGADEERAPEDRDGTVVQLNALGDEFFRSESANADKWATLPAEYVAAFLTNLSALVKAERPIEWEPVIKLCTQVLGRSDGGWDSKWMRRVTADVVLAGLDARGQAGIPGAHRAAIQGYVTDLSDAALGEPREKRVNDESDYLTAAINSLAGKAVEVGIRYAVWLKVLSGSIQDGFLKAEAPEAEALLSEWVKPSQSRPVDARAIFGMQLGPLFWLDESWVKAHDADLFPSEPAASKHREAVWDTYLSYGSPFGQAFEALRAQYRRSVLSLSSATKSPTAARRDPDEHLSEHLMVYLWQGLLSRGDADRLLESFFEGATVELRSHSIDFVGRSLRNSNESVPEPIGRLKSFFDWRLESVSVARGLARSHAAAELDAFGWWFASGKFDDDWSLRTLVRIRELGANPEPDHLIAERLLQLVDRHQRLVAEALFHMVSAPSQPYSIAGWRDEARAILEKLRLSSDPVVLRRVKEAVNALLGNRFFEFRDLAR